MIKPAHLETGPAGTGGYALWMRESLAEEEKAPPGNLVYSGNQSKSRVLYPSTAVSTCP